MLLSTVIMEIVVLLVGCSPVTIGAAKQPKISVRGPTIIAFFSPVTQAELEKGTSGTNEALADFQFYAAQVRAPLSKSAIAFHEIYAHSFWVIVGSRSAVFKPDKVEVDITLSPQAKSHALSTAL